MLLWLAKVLKLALGLKIGLATTFFPANDPGNPDPHLACIHRDLRLTDMVVAHPTLPCRSRVLLWNPRTRRAVVATIGDRGPRHAMIDLAPAVSRKLRHNGRERIVMLPLEE